LRLVNVLGYENIISTKAVIVDLTPPEPGQYDETSYLGMISKVETSYLGIITKVETSYLGIISKVHK